MTGETIVTVRGEASVESEPEIAVFDVTVTVRDKDRARAVELLAKRGRDLGALMENLGEAIERLESKPVRVQPVFKDGKVKAAVGFHAHGGFSVTVGDFAVLGELITALAGEDLVTLGGPWWQLRPDSPVHREVRLAAAKDSLARARDYAEAFGGQITGLAEVADTGLLAEDRPARTAYSSAMLHAQPAGGYGGDESPEIDLIPAAQTVYAQVEARFLMTSPLLQG